MAWDRRGGHATGVTGVHITWSLAEGARGTRWRESATRDGVLLRAILLEVAPAGSVLRVEIATAAGLLTLHPAPDASAIHGNVVTPHGVRHLAFAWSPVHEIHIAGSPSTDAVAVRRLVAGLGVGERGSVDVLAMDDELEPRPGRWTVERPASDRWEFSDEERNTVRSVRVGPDGVPVLEAAAEWLLEP